MPLDKYDSDVIEVLNGVVVTLPLQDGMRYMKSNFMTIEIIHQKVSDQYSFVVHNPYYGTSCEADWMTKKDLLPALREMQVALGALVQELEGEVGG